ncbi:MAG: GlsB/YeaQ/YmgE family stress response membrane protein [Rhodobacteraceae bacterium]|nr:GlsB/YeaQ/YmgE family stress response membrane protein [Paracoccaceae bacterium]
MEEQIGTGFGVLFGLLIVIGVGAIVGYLASLMVKGGGSGFWGDVLIGIGGSFLAGWLLPLLGIHLGGLVGSIIAAVIGAVILLLIVRMIRRTGS